MSGHQLGGDAGEGNVQILERDAGQLLVEQCAQPVAADQAGAAPGDVQEREQAAPSDGTGEFLQHCDTAGGKAAANQSADRSPGDGSGHYPRFDEPVDHANMSPATSGAGPEGNADRSF